MGGRQQRGSNLIDDSKDRVVSIRLRKTDYKIHGYLLERKALGP